MRTLLIDAAGYRVGKAIGVNSYFDNLLCYFTSHRNQLKYEKIILACDKSQTEHFKKYDYFDIVGLDCSSYIKRFWIQNRYRKLFNLSDDDLIFWPLGYTSITKSCRFLLVMHDLLYLHPKIMGNLKTSLALNVQKIVCPISIKRSDRVVTISKWVKKDIITAYGTDSDKITPIYSYFNFEKYGRDYSDSVKNIASSNYFLVVSADYPHKHISTVLKAFVLFAQEDKESILIIVGKMGEERKQEIENLKDEVKKRIKVLSGISNDDLAYLYRGCRAYINATEFEGLGMPFVEAMYFGCKVVASNIEVVREVTGDKAIYFDCIDYKGLAHIMTNIDDYSMPADSASFVKTQYSEENTSGKYIEVINSFAD